MKAEIIYFSATGTTKKIVNAIADGLRCEVCLSDITLPQQRLDFHFDENDLTVLAFPVYGERIPAFLYDFVSRIDGRGKALAGIAVYGNMGYGVSLEQYATFAKSNRFVLIATAAFNAQHTYASSRTPAGLGRPDEFDLLQAKEFGEKIHEKMNSERMEAICVPGCTVPKFLTKLPDGGVRHIIRKPSVNPAVCNACGVCVKRCPVGAIDKNTLAIDEKKCLRCYACVHACQKNARIAEFRSPVFETVFRKLGGKRKVNTLLI